MIFIHNSRILNEIKSGIKNDVDDNTGNIPTLALEQGSPSIMHTVAYTRNCRTFIPYKKLSTTQFQFDQLKNMKVNFLEREFYISHMHETANNSQHISNSRSRFKSNLERVKKRVRLSILKFFDLIINDRCLKNVLAHGKRVFLMLHNL